MRSTAMTFDVKAPLDIVFQWTRHLAGHEFAGMQAWYAGTDTIDIGGAFEVLRAMMLADPGESPDEADAARAIRTIARKARVELVADSEMSETAILAEIRSLLVDMLMIAGLRRSSAVATLR